MAGVLDALASYVTSMLTEMAKEEVAMLIGVSGEIDKLSVKLGDLKHFLADAGRRNINDESVQAWVMELKRAMYLATDILDMCQLKAMERSPSKGMGCFNPLLFCMRNPLHAHDIGTRINALNEKLDGICTRGRSFNFINLASYDELKMTQSLATNRKTDSVMARSSAVGQKIEQDTRKLVEMLTKEVVGDKSDCHTVVAIVGVGGIGKTTLGKKIFNDEAIISKFNKRIWLSITRDFNEVDLLSTAISAAGGDLPRAGGAHDRALLVVALRNAIKDKKFFLVLDDMWGVDVWDKLLMTPFSYGGLASRVLITTRHDTVGRSMRVVHYHHVDKLGPEDAWSLLKNQVLTSGENELELYVLKDIGLQIIEKCDGLPLAIKVMGGLLCKKEKTQRDWEDVLNDDIWSVSRLPDELNHAIYLSYEDLHPFLKQCFLHFSLKPKSTELEINQVVSMWIGEGLVQGDTRSLDEGIKYYMDLILRNLIEIDPTRPGQFVCSMHDVVRSFAQFMARDEALATHGGDTANEKLRSHSFLRLSIETRGVESEEFEWRCLREQKSLRTLIFAGRINVQSGDSLISISGLRTLHVEYANFSPLVESLCQLKHLRYLSLRFCTDICGLPENIHEMKFLQHIDLEGCKSIGKIPDSIVKLRDLIYLVIPNTNMHSIPRGFGALKNMRAMWGFPAYMDGDWCSLEEIGPLSQLTELGLTGLENVSDPSSVAKAQLGAKKHLIRLWLECESRQGGVSEEEEKTIEAVFDVLCPLPCIEFLLISGYFGCHLPRWMMLTATVPLVNLTTLYLYNLSYCTQFPDGLCRLPCLEFLEFYHAPAIKHVGPEFVQPHNYHHHASSQAVAAFPRLHNMFFEEMVEWEEWKWEVEVEGMPTLEELRVKKCKLRCIPPGLAFHARSLKKLTIWNAKGLHSLENFASVVELDLSYIPYLTRISSFPKLQKLKINLCSKLELLQEMNALRRLILTIYYDKKQLPQYLQAVNPSNFVLDCSPKLLASMAAGKAGPEWDSFSHIKHVEVYADDLDKGVEKRWHLFYTSEPYSMETNIDLQELIEPAEQSSGSHDNSQDENEEDRMGHDLQEWESEEWSSWGDDEEYLDNNQDRNEDERMGHDQQDRPVETQLSGLAGLTRLGDEDKAVDVDRNPDITEVDQYIFLLLEKRKD